MSEWRGTLYQLYWHTESWLPRYVDLSGRYSRRLFVHRDRYITMHDYTLLIPERGGIAHYEAIGMIIINDERGVRLGFSEAMDE